MALIKPLSEQTLMNNYVFSMTVKCRQRIRKTCLEGCDITKGCLILPFSQQEQTTIG